MMKKLFILDPGHGGMVNDKYVTAPNKMWTFPNGTVIHEGVINRKIVGYIKILSRVHDLQTFDITGGSQFDIPLGVRVDTANALRKEYEDVVYCSIHCNAGKGKGTEIFTSPGQTKSDKHATVVMECLESKLPEFTVRADYSDGDIDKEAKFYVLTETACPAWLLEVGFMDNEHDARLLLDDDYLFSVAEAIVLYMKKAVLTVF